MCLLFRSTTPPLSPCNSRDSGISGLSNSRANDIHQWLQGSNKNSKSQIMARVVAFLKDEFSDSFLDTGVEDITMADYVLSLSNLHRDTFSRAIVEKFSDFYWPDTLLEQLYNTVNETQQRSLYVKNKSRRYT